MTKIWQCDRCGHEEPLENDDAYALGDSEACVHCKDGVARVVAGEETVDEAQADRKRRLERSRSVRAVSRRLQRAMDDAVRIAKLEGIANPSLYFESRGAIYVLDNDHPRYAKADGQKAVVFELSCKMPIGSDVGAW